MSQPTAYEPAHEFLNDEAQTPAFPGSELDIEFNALERTTDEIRTNLALIQRDDGALKNGVVTADSLDTVLAAALGDLSSIAEVQALVDEAEASATAATASQVAAAASETAAEAAEVAAEAAQAAAEAAAASIPGINGTPTSGNLTSWHNATTIKDAGVAISTDGTLASNSDAKIPTEKAVKTYADALLAASDAMVYRGATDCSANPNYPAASRGDTYRVSVAGKIGGASGVTVEVGDFFICNTDSTASGDQAAVGANWNVIQTNIVGAYYAGGTDVAVADGGTGASTASGARTNLAAAAAAQTEEFMAGYIKTVADGTIKLVVKIPHAGTITSVTTISESGTCTATFKINTTALGGTANSVSNSKQSQAHASNNVFAADDDIQVTISANSTCLGMSFTIKYSRTLA